MSEKLNHSDLSALLAKEAEISVAKAEGFTKVLFDLIIEGLEQDGIVKINGLGTFKVTEVADRYSVNVNTGEKFEIKGHRKLNFVPADALKESVNKPFAMFAPVEVDDTYQDDADVQDSDEERGEETAAVAVAEDVPETAANESAEETATVEAAEDAPVVTQDEATEEQTAVEPVAEKEETVPVEVAQPVAPVSVKREPVTVSRKKSDKAKEAPHRKRSGSKAIVAVMAIILVGMGYYWFIGKEKEEVVKKKKSNALTDVQKANSKRKGISAGGMQFVESNATGKSKAANINPSVVANDTLQGVVVETPKSVKVQSASQPTYPVEIVAELAKRKDREITMEDTTLYDITGDFTVHTVAEGENLAKLSVKYYKNRKLWPYIAKHNRMANPGDIATGMRLTIPKLQPK